MTIVRGEDKTIVVRLVDADTRDPFVLDANVTAISANFQGDGGAGVEKDLDDGVTILDIDTGKLKIELDPDDTNALALGVNKSFELEITKSGVVSVVQFIGILAVNDSVELMS
jgi:hypothetical protein